MNPETLHVLGKGSNAKLFPDFFLLTFLLLICVYECASACVYLIAHVEFRTTFTVCALLPHVGSRDLTWFVRLDSKHLHPLNHLADPDPDFLRQCLTV